MLILRVAISPAKKFLYFARSLNEEPMTLPRYTGNDFKIMLGILTPYVFLLNTVLLGTAFFSSPVIFTGAMVTALFIKCISWQFHTLLAVVLRTRYPRDAQILKRITIALLCFFVMTALANSFVVLLYQKAGLFHFTFSWTRFRWALLTGMVLNVFATLVHEGVSNLEKWKDTLTETEQLQTAYAKSQLEGLKSQIKPHFLFNSINTLSALIDHNPKTASVFLDEMCKVYRYLLQHEAGHFVALRQETSFMKSYFFILKARYADAINLEMHIDEEAMECRVPPFTLQLLMENVLQQNVISKENPLRIKVMVDKVLTVTHSQTAKITAATGPDDSPLKNINTKFRLLGLEEVSIEEQSHSRVIRIPLVHHENEFLS